MKISYHWLKEYLPSEPSVSGIIESPQKISDILTSVGLEVETLEKFEELPGSLAGIVTGEVVHCEKHPDADKLKITKVDIGTGEPLQIVCGAPNVAKGQKVIIATIGSKLHPVTGEAFTIKKSKIRGVESNGMICAEDEIGLGNSHDGIRVLPENTPPGMNASEYFKVYTDHIFEIGLTPNRMDAMSHLGVAKDVSAYLSHHFKKDLKVKSPLSPHFKASSEPTLINVEVENPGDCPRYSGIVISGIAVAPSPKWLQNRLKSIGQKPLNNIVDITNFVLHETGQPLHAFDADKIKGNKIIVKKLPENTSFITLDEKERKLSAEDLMICDGDSNPMCIAGVFGGAESGVSHTTVNIFLESAAFNPISIRKSMLRHNLRTDAAIRFEKETDISNTVNAMLRAAILIEEIAGGKISSKIIDIYPVKKEKKEIVLSNHYLKKISGKNYHPDTVKNILTSLNFTILREGIDEIQVAAPFSNPDITHPVDIIEEIMRIDGLDNIAIPATVSMAPSKDNNRTGSVQKEKVVSWLLGNGFFEIFTNSITNSNYFNSESLSESVSIINSLSEDLNIMRPSLLPTGLECISYNINRKNTNLLLLEFGKTYHITDRGFSEKENLALYFSGNINETAWHNQAKKTDIFFVKGICHSIFKLLGITNFSFDAVQDSCLSEAFSGQVNKIPFSVAGKVNKVWLDQFSIKQPVYYLCIDWQKLVALTADQKITFEPVARFPQVKRDLSIVLNKEIPYQSVESLVKSLQLKKLIHVQLFDIFESEKLGKNKKSFAINFTFLDKEKTLVDNDIETMMAKITDIIESKLVAEIRRNA